MKRELFIHFCFWASYFILIILFNRLFDWGVVLFVLGGLLGVILPDIDHLIYVYLLKPQDLSSQRINYLINKKDLIRSVSLLYETRIERRDLIFHTIFFQGLFFILMFLILSSSNSLLGKGLVLSFMLHLSVDQFIDIRDFGSLDNWYKNLPFRFHFNQAKIYWIASTAVILLMGVLL